MRQILASLVLFVWVALPPLLWSPAPATADEEAPAGRAPAGEAPAGKEMVWDGFLFRDDEGRVRLGWPVIAMGVMAMPAHVVEGDVAARLGPLLTEVKDDHVFWNYDLERRGDEALDGIPRALVRLRGRVTLERPDDPNWGSYRGGTRAMRDAQLVNVEFLSEAWLRHWGRIFRHGDSPFRIDLDRGTITDAELMGFAKKAIATLHAMRAVPQSGEAERKLARTIDPDARVVSTHRRRSEWDLQRWLVGMATKHADLELERLDALPPLPPTTVELQRLFLESETKQAFLAGVRKLWRGALDALQLPCYVEDGRSTVWTLVDLGRVDRKWSEDEYRARRTTTQRMVGR